MGQEWASNLVGGKEHTASSGTGWVEGEVGVDEKGHFAGSFLGGAEKVVEDMSGIE